MINNRKMNTRKRIAFAVSSSNRKSFIEWSYYNQEILKQHELIASNTMAGILEGTIGVPVTRLPDTAAAANQQLMTMIAEQKIDILLFFWDPVQALSQENGIRTLHHMAIAHNIITACNLATANFVLSSLLMNKAHSVPVLPELVYSDMSHVPASHFQTPDRGQAVLKVNTIH